MQGKTSMVGYATASIGLILSSATSILFLVGSIISLSYLFISSGIPKFSPLASIPLYFYFGAFFVIFYIFSITWAAPKFGISNAIAFALLGQVISMAIIDHYGLFGALKSSVSIQRLAGLALMVTGIFMAVRRS